MVGVDLSKIKKEYEQLKAEVRKTESNISDTNAVLKKYQEKTMMDAESVKQALNDSKQAQDDAKKAEGIIISQSITIFYALMDF